MPHARRALKTTSGVRPSPLSGIRCLVLLGLYALTTVAWAVPSEPPTAAEAAQETFAVWEFQVEGNTLLPAIDIERAVYGHLGESKTIDDVTAAQRHLEALYHERGYGTVLVDIPEQDVSGGVVRLKVTEAKVARLRVTGSRYFSLGRIKSKVPSLAAGSVPNLKSVQSELGKVGQLSRDRTITPVLRPSRTPGRVEVELKVKDQLPLHGSVELNDRYSADTTRLRLSGSIRYDNVWQREHSAGFSYQTTPEDPDEVQVFAGNYLWRFEEIDHLLSAYAVKSESSVATIGTLGVIGSGVIAGLRYSIPLRTLGNYFHTATLGVDYKDFDEDIALAGNNAVVTPISYVMFSTNYSGTHFGEETVSHFDVTVNVAPRGLGNTQKEFERKRFKAKPNFVYARLRADHLLPVFAGNALFARIDSQVSDSPIVNNEQYAAGGFDNVRGYLESEKQADDAAFVSLELRSLNLAKDDWPFLRSLQLFTFVDAAALRIKSPLPGSDAGKFLWSTGLGVRLGTLEAFQAQLNWAYPLRDGERIEAGESRVNFNFGYQF